MQKNVTRPADRMLRKQILLTREQQTRLKARAAAMGRPEAELVREALESWLDRQAVADEDWKAAFRKIAGIWKDRTDLDELDGDRRRRRQLRREGLMRRTAK